MEESVPKWLIPDRVYGVAKWVGLIVLPALAVCFGTVAPAWGLDAGVSQAVVLTLNAVGTCVGAVIGVTTAAAKRGDADGAEEA